MSYAKPYWIRQRCWTRKKQNIKDNQAKYYRLLNAIHEVYYSANVAGNITEISPSIGTVAGYDCDEIVGRSATFFTNIPGTGKLFLKSYSNKGLLPIMNWS